MPYDKQRGKDAQLIEKDQTGKYATVGEIINNCINSLVRPISTIFNHDMRLEIYYINCEISDMVTYGPQN